ncbi:MAG TPA: hypothetical protein VF549_19355 [Solirubrobacteraceae bacterium]|jgi:hypothetical protein
MGVLDDAIREHLELKRRRGADPAEVEQQEREALGPVGDGAGAVASATVPADVELPGHDPEPEPEPPEPEPLPADPEPAPIADPDPTEYHGAVRAPEPDLEPEPAHESPPPVSQPTQQYSVEDLEDLEDLRPEAQGGLPADVVPADDEPEPEGEDVLDETPEFLQEAPEHDRLWFEQRPPRDFDF